MSEYHLPVMLTECMEGLNIHPDGIYVDVTFGGGGHSRAILERLSPEGRLLAFDQDADALNNAIDDPRFTLIHENFAHLKSFLRLHGVRQIDGLLADLGVSSHQFDEGSRGFTFRTDGPLDLRMDRRQEMTAAQIVNSLEEGDLARLLRLYGELPNAMAMARSICAARKQAPIETTLQLREAVQRHLPRQQENKFLAMLFQALRIEVNGELDALRQMLQQSIQVLKPGGRLVVMSYHSLEDRLVKNFMKTGNFEGNLEKDFYGNPLTPLNVISRKAITAQPEELEINNRARSAKLRIAEAKQPKENN